MGGTCAVCSSTNYKGKGACMTASHAAWLRALHDRSSDSSSGRWRKGAGVDISTAGAFKFPARSQGKEKASGSDSGGYSLGRL